MRWKMVVAGLPGLGMLGMLAGCSFMYATRWRDLSGERAVRESGVIGKRFVMVEAGELWGTNYYGDVLASVSRGGEEREGTCESMPAGIRYRVVAVKEESTIEVTRRHTYVELETGPHAGMRVMLGFWEGAGPANEPYVEGPLPWADAEGVAATGLMADGLESSDWAVRWHAARDLGRVEDRERAGVALEKSLRDADAMVRREVWGSLAAIAPASETLIEKAVATLHRGQGKPAAVDEKGAIALLAKIGEPAVPALLAALARNRRELAVIGGLNPEGKFGELQQENFMECHDILEAFEGMGLKARGAIPAIVGTLRGSAGNAVGSALASIDAVEGVKQLIPLLEDRDAHVCARAGDEIVSMAGMSTGLEAVLVPLLRDPDAAVRVVGVTGLGKVLKPDETVIPHLLPMLEDESPVVRRVAIDAIYRQVGEHPEEFRKVLAALEKLLKDADAGVREDAAQAVRILNCSADGR